MSWYELAVGMIAAKFFWIVLGAVLAELKERRDRN
jgi:hypothetical protein